jgi:uncharacterized protein YecA (UPF0149 family)
MYMGQTANTTIMSLLCVKGNVGRNDPSICGSQKKYKKCYGKLLLLLPKHLES